MSKTPFSKKCEIIGSVWSAMHNEKDNPKGWDKFFSINDIGGPLAFMVANNIATIKSGKKFYIEETWENACRGFALDPNGYFENIDDFVSKANARYALMAEYGMLDDDE